MSRHKRPLTPNTFDRELAMIELRTMVKYAVPLFGSALDRLGKAGMLADDPNIAWLYEQGWVDVSERGNGWIVTAQGKIAAMTHTRPHCSTCTCWQPRT